MRCLSRLLDRFLNWAVPTPASFPLVGADFLTDLEADIDSHPPQPPSDDIVWAHLDQWASEEQAADDITALVSAVLRAHNLDNAEMYAQLVAEVLTDHYEFPGEHTDDDDD